MAGTLVANTINTDTGLFSTNNAYTGIAKAWVQFSATGGTIIINKSFNCSSITRSVTGVYIFNFTTAMTDTGYVPTVVAGGTTSINAGQSFVFQDNTTGATQNPTVNSFYFGVRNNSGSTFDPPYVCVAVLGN
jgi:hypothetical protein